jgi:hypothetical protein
LQTSAKLKDPVTKKSAKITLEGPYVMHIMTNGSLAMGERVTETFSGVSRGVVRMRHAPYVRAPPPLAHRTAPASDASARGPASRPPPPLCPSVCADGYGGNLQTTEPSPSGCSMCAAGAYGLGLGLRTGCKQCKVGGAWGRQAGTAPGPQRGSFY